ncbi:MAG: histidine kinase [Desulfobacterales bacterium]|nr:histidine kinase [Desulfobacterales bacterium]
MAEPAVQYSRAGLLGIINALPLAILIIDRNRKILLANKVCVEFTGKKIDTLQGTTIGKAFGCINHNNSSKGCGFSQDCTLCLFKDALDNTLDKAETIQMVETPKELVDKGKFALRFSTKPLNLGGKTVALLSIEDLTQDKALEQIRIEREKLATALETTGGICHEISQPLQVIKGYCEILSIRKGLTKDVANALFSIQTEVEKLARLTHDLNHITRYETKPYLKSKIIDIEKSAR